MYKRMIYHLELNIQSDKQIRAIKDIGFKVDFVFLWDKGSLHAQEFARYQYRYRRVP